MHSLGRYTAAALVLLLFSAGEAYAGPAYNTNNDYSVEKQTEGEPLVVIRFNQENVYYQLPLHNAVKKAVSTYPGVFFDIVSIIPTTGDFKTDENSSEVAAENVKKVMITMEEIGVPRARIEPRYTTSAGAEYGEIRIYAR